MEYQKKKKKLLDETPNQLTKSRTKNWVEINDESLRTYKTNTQSRFKTSMLRSSLCDYSDAYIHVKENVTVVNAAALGQAASNANKKVILKGCAPFTSSISKINNTQIDDAQNIYVVMPMYNLIEYSDTYSKISEDLWQYCRDIPAVNDDDDGEITNFTEANATTNLFNLKVTLTVTATVLEPRTT